MKTLLGRLFPQRAEKLRARLEDMKEREKQAVLLAATAEEQSRSATANYWRAHWQSRVKDAESTMRYCSREQSRLLWQLSVFA